MHAWALSSHPRVSGTVSRVLRRCAGESTDASGRMNALQVDSLDGVDVWCLLRSLPREGVLRKEVVECVGAQRGNRVRLHKLCAGKVTPKPGRLFHILIGNVHLLNKHKSQVSG